MKTLGQTIPERRNVEHFRFAILTLDHSPDQNCLQFKRPQKTCMMSSLYQKRICIKASQMTLFKLQGFHDIIRKDRADGQGGEVAVYVRGDTAYKRLLNFEVAGVEAIWL